MNCQTVITIFIIITNCNLISNCSAAEDAVISLTTKKTPILSIIQETTENSATTTSDENMIMSSTNNYISRVDTKKVVDPPRSKILDNIFNVSISQ